MSGLLLISFLTLCRRVKDEKEKEMQRLREMQEKANDR